MAQLFRASLALLFAHLMLAYPVAARAQPDETITVSQTPWDRLCMGMCPFYRVVVHSDGRIHMKDAFGPPWPDQRLSPEETARFATLLEPYRPSGTPAPDAVCPHPRLLKNPPPPEPEIEITWSGTSTSRLTACAFGTDQLQRSIEAALHAIKLDPMALFGVIKPGDPRPLVTHLRRPI